MQLENNEGCACAVKRIFWIWNMQKKTYEPKGGRVGGARVRETWFKLIALGTRIWFGLRARASKSSFGGSLIKIRNGGEKYFRSCLVDVNHYLWCAATAWFLGRSGRTLDNL